MKSLLRTVCVAASLALIGNAGTAAAADAQSAAKTQTVHVRTSVMHRAAPAAHTAAARRSARVARVASRRRYPSRYVSLDIGGLIQAMLAGAPMQYSALARNLAGLRVTGRSAGAYSAGYSPSYDSAPAASGIDDTAQQALDEANEINMQNSMEAAQEQNDEADAETNAGIAAAEQTEINANQ